MNRCRIFWAIAGLAILGSLTSGAQDKGYWQAASNTARSITGDISLSDTKVTINFLSFVMAPIRSLNAGEVAAAFDADANAGGSGALYRLRVPAERRFLHKNTLCGTEDTQWMATYVSGRTLQVAFFSGDNTPILSIDALSNSTTLCGTFTYGR